MIDGTRPISDLCNNAVLVIFNHTRPTYSDNVLYNFLDLGLKNVYYGTTTMSIREYNHVVLSE